MPTTVNGHQTQPKAKERTNDRRCGRGKVQQVPSHHHRSAGQPCDRVKVGPQDRGNLGQEEVAHHAAADAGQHPEQRRHDGVQPERERLLCA